MHSRWNAVRAGYQLLQPGQPFTIPSSTRLRPSPSAQRRDRRRVLLDSLLTTLSIIAHCLLVFRLVISAHQPPIIDAGSERPHTMSPSAHSNSNSNSHFLHSTSSSLRSRPFHSNTPGSAIDLTEMATPPSVHTPLHASTPSPPPRSRPGSVIISGELREEVWHGGREGVTVEMGGGMGDLAVLLRTIDFAAQVSGAKYGLW